MKTIEKIFEKYANRLGENWLNQKRKEFLSSNELDKALNQIVLKYTSIKFVYDSNGNEIGDEQILIEENWGFLDYCLMDTNDNNESSQRILASIQLKKIETLNLELLADEFAQKLYSQIEQVPIINCNEAIQNILVQLNQYCKSISIIDNNDHEQLLTYFIDCTKISLNDLLAEKLELQNYLRPIEEKLVFNLNSEDFTAFMRILLESKIINEPELKLADISAKYFLYTPQGKEKTFLNVNDFKKEIDRHSNPGHKGKGLENIKEKIEKGINLIYKMQDKDLKNLGQSHRKK
jgi:hypothetical protein